MIRILYVDHVTQPGGAQYSLLTLIEGLDRRRFEPHIALPSDSGPFPDQLRKLEVPLHRVPLGWLRRTPPILGHLRSAYLIEVSRSALGRVAKRIDPHIIHANSSAAQAACAALRLPRRRVVWHLRDMTPLGAFGRYLAARADLRIAPSNAAAEFHRQTHSDASPFRVIPNGIDVRRFSPEVDGSQLRKELGVPDNAILFGAIGQAVPWKRLQDLLAVDRGIAADKDIHRLVLAADPFGHVSKHVQALKDQAARLARCHVIGWRDDVERVIAALDVLVNPAQAETFGRTVVEAMACAKPVIAANRGGPAEIVLHGQTGLLFPPGDLVELAAAMRRLADDPDLRRSMGQAGRRRALSEYSATAHVRRMEALYEELLST